MNAAPMSCATAGERVPSKPSHTHPSMNWGRAKSGGRAAKSHSRRCLTLVNVSTPIVPKTPLPTKLATAEKHIPVLLLTCFNNGRPGGHNEFAKIPPASRDHRILAYEDAVIAGEVLPAFSRVHRRPVKLEIAPTKTYDLV